MNPSEETPKEDKESPEYDTSSSGSLAVVAGRDFKKSKVLGKGDLLPGTSHSSSV